MFCPKCGKEIPENSIYCPDCGTATGESGANFDVNQVKNGKAVAILGYIFPILFFIPLASQQKRTPYGLKHANSALIILIIDAVSSCLTTISKNFLYGYGSTIIQIICYIVSVLAFVAAIIGIVYACTGTKKDLPVIGKWHIIDK